MAQRPNFPLLEDPAELAHYQGWSREVYTDLLAVGAGRISHADFDEKYARTRAVLVLDVTGFTISTIRGGAVSSFLRILDIQKICFPALREYGATFVQAFADDVVALFDEPGAAVDAALEIRRRVANFNEDSDKHDYAPECCIGIGYGLLYDIGPNHAMGDEMNRASVLGEDTARGGEILVTEGVREALMGERSELFEPQTGDDPLFRYYRVSPKD